ncbi:MAG: adenosylcobinamide-phosphate synthase CbiB [Gammaproteobacteria bacterium]|nr:adenosylcobinamide-phosphate synthase CbiB [Gammaproteobacteria bacterium]
MYSVYIVIAALVLDRLLGEPTRWHPLVGFGQLVQHIERVMYDPSDTQNRWRGIVSVVFAVLPIVIAASVLTQFLPALVEIIALYLVIGWRSLEEHAFKVSNHLHSGDVATARNAVGMMVSRDTHTLTTAEVSKATVESVLENGNDAVFGALFWFLIFGAPGAIAFRLVNTLDAMWGYKNSRYLHFGWAAARLDDVMNYVPARLTALSYSLAGQLRNGLACWRSQGVHWKSPNAGPVMAAGAGSLGILLGGAAIYHGTPQQRPALGVGREPRTGDIHSAIYLLRRAMLWWLLVIVVVTFISASYVH